jgi:four helix bundle protein
VRNSSLVKRSCAENLTGLKHPTEAKDASGKVQATSNKERTMGSYKDLKVYQRAYKAALAVHRIAKEMPSEESRDLVWQLRSSSRSIVANLVEGYSRQRTSKAALRVFLVNAIGSCDETKLWLEMAKDLGYVSTERYEKAAREYDEVGKMLFGLLKRYS